MSETKPGEFDSMNEHPSVRKQSDVACEIADILQASIVYAKQKEHKDLIVKAVFYPPTVIQLTDENGIKYKATITRTSQRI